MHILFVHVDTETFVHLTCIYTLTLWAFRWGESVYPHPPEQCFFITPTIWGIEMKFGPVDKVSLETVWGQNYTTLQMTYFETQSDFTEQFFDILKWLFSFSSQRHSVTLRTLKISLKKRSLLMTPFSIFDDTIKKVVSGQQIIHQSREPFNYFIDRHHFTMDIAGPDINCMLCLKVEILGGEGVCVSSILSVASFLCLHTTR